MRIFVDTSTLQNVGPIEIASKSHQSNEKYLKKLQITLETVVCHLLGTEGLYIKSGTVGKQSF